MSPIANMLVQIKNAQAAHKEHVLLPFSNIKYNIVTLLKNNGFINEVERKQKKVGKSELTYIFLKLKYQDRVGAITDIKLISKPSRRIYTGKAALRPVMNGYGMSIISTSKGLMTGSDARKQGLGGEFICEVW